MIINSQLLTQSLQYFLYLNLYGASESSLECFKGPAPEPRRGRVVAARTVRYYWKIEKVQVCWLPGHGSRVHPQIRAQDTGEAARAVLRALEVARRRRPGSAQAESRQGSMANQAVRNVVHTFKVNARGLRSAYGE